MTIEKDPLWVKCDCPARFFLSTIDGIEALTNAAPF